jgi:hypothetical protein
MIRCLACNGTYHPILRDGCRYFHVCPPLLDPKTGAESPRANARNENAPPAAALAALVDASGLVHTAAGDDPANKLRDAAMVSAGAGVTVEADPVP